MFKFRIILALSVSLIITIASCERLKRKGDSIVDRTKNKVVKAKDAAVDKIIPAFDSYKPDTESNKKRFKDFFGFPPSSDVTELYSFGDHMGIDGKFMFSFHCAEATKEKIIRNLGLMQAEEPDNFSIGLWEKFPWWDSSKIVTIKPYWKKGDHEFYKYLWHDKENRKIYYIDFDL
jgi:hypothetical protein